MNSFSLGQWIAGFVCLSASTLAQDTNRSTIGAVGSNAQAAIAPLLASDIRIAPVAFSADAAAMTDRIKPLLSTTICVVEQNGDQQWLIERLKNHGVIIYALPSPSTRDSYLRQRNELYKLHAILVEAFPDCRQELGAKLDVQLAKLKYRYASPVTKQEGRLASQIRVENITPSAD